MCNLAEDFVEEHGGGFLHIVAAGMEEGVEGEVGTLFQVIAVATPRHLLAVNIQTDAHGSRLLERLKIAFEALVAHQLARCCCKICR